MKLHTLLLLVPLSLPLSVFGGEVSALAYNFDTFEPYHDDQSLAETSPLGPVAQARSGQEWTNSAAARMGRLDCSASLTSLSTTSRRPIISGKTYWFDSITINSPGVAEGTIGEARVRLFFEGMVEASPLGPSLARPRGTIAYNLSTMADGADGRPDLYIVGAGAFFSADPTNAGPGGSVNFLNTPREHVMTFRFGKPLDVTLRTEAKAEVWNHHAGSAKAEIRATGWTGIDSVVIQGPGTPVTTYTVTSTSGLDFAKPITGTPDPDTTKPTITLDSPANGAVIASGPLTMQITAADTGGIRKVECSVQRSSDTLFWNGTGWGGTTLLLPTVYNAATGKWDCTGPVPQPGAALADGSYWFSAVATDNAGNSQQAISAVTVAYVPPTTPTVTIISPSNGSVIQSGPVTIQGTASAPSGIFRVECFVRRNSDGLYWNGSGWGGATLHLPTEPTAGTDAWVCLGPVPQPAVALADGSYNFIAIATDTAGNIRQVDSAVTVAYDGTATIISPSNGAVIQSEPVTIQGTASAPSGIFRVECFVRRNSDGLYWNGSGWGGDTLHLPTHYTPATGAWVCTGPVPQPGSALADGSYNFIAIATDIAGNVQQVDAAVTVALVAPTPPEMFATSADPGTTPGDVFQGAIIHSAPGSPVYPGFDLRDVFGGEFSTLELGRTVLADGLGSAVQKIYFHTAAPVTLSGYKLYLGDDPFGRGASRVELALTDASFSINAVFSTVDLASPYPSDPGADAMRRILVSDTFPPVTGQYFVLHLTPRTPDHGVRVIEFDGIAPSHILAASHADFSTIGFTGALTPQTAINGFTYGYYTTDATTGAFSTNNMLARATANGTYWAGNQDGGTTPEHVSRYLHPGVNPSTAVVRRYTIGSGGEPAHTGSVRLVGRFSDLNTGNTDVFIAIDQDGDAGAAPRSLLFVPSPVRGLQGVSFDVTTIVAPGTTIDFGALATADGGSSDSTAFYAWIVTDDAPVPTNIVANAFNSLNFPFSAPGQDPRGLAFPIVTDGMVGGTDLTSFDTTPGTGFPYQFAGLLYLEDPASGKATRFDSVRIDVTTEGDFSDTPRLYLLRHNSHPASNNPAADDRYARLPVVPVRIAANSAAQPAYTFDLTGLNAAQRTGYGFAVVGAGKYQGTSIAVSEIFASAVRVPNADAIAPHPFLVQWTNDHRYGLTVIRGDWEAAEAEAVKFGGHLLALNASEENTFITTAFGHTEEMFIGLRQNLSSPGYSEPAGGFEWVNGDPVTFTNWHGPAFGGTEPNNASGPGEEFVVMGSAGPLTATWGDVKKAGYPETSNYRGIIELPTPGTGERNYYLSNISAKSNIFDAGLAPATQGGVLPPSIDISGLAGQFVTFPQIVGVINTADDIHGPDGAHTPDRSCNLTSVGGISGYLNGNNTPALVGVFLGPTRPASPPARLDFSINGLGENFTTLAPVLGQVFFIGDGFTGGGLEQQFIIPLGATRLYLGVPDGNSGTLYHGTPGIYGDNSGSVSLRASIAPGDNWSFDFTVPAADLTVAPDEVVHATLTVINPDALDRFTYVVDFGDGNPGISGSLAAGQTTLNLDHTYVVQGLYTIVGTLSNGAESRSQSFTITVTSTIPVGVTFTIYVDNFGLTGPEADPNADGDGDGQTVYEEYVFNTDPTVSGPAPQNGSLVNIGGQQWLALTYRRYADREAAGVVYTSQTRVDLGAWSGAGIIDEIDPTASIIAGSTACRCRVPIGNAKVQLLRVKAEKQ